MVSIFNEMFMNIYKCLNPWLPYVTKIKFKRKLIKVLYACMVHGKGIKFCLYREGNSDAYCHAREKYEKVTNA